MRLGRRMGVEHAACGRQHRQRHQQAEAGELMLRRDLQPQQARGQRRAAHRAEAEHAVQAAENGAPAHDLQRRAFGIDRHVVEAHRRAEDQHRRQQQRQRGPVQHQRQHQAHHQRAGPRRAACAQPRDDAPGGEQRHHRAGRRRQQHQRQHGLVQAVVHLDRRDVHAPGAADQPERREQHPGGAARPRQPRGRGAGPGLAERGREGRRHVVQSFGVCRRSRGSTFGQRSGRRAEFGAAHCTALASTRRICGW